MTDSQSPQFLTPQAIMLLDTMPIPIAIYGVDGIVAAINRAAEEYWKLSRDDYIGIVDAASDPYTGQDFVAARRRILSEGIAFERTPPTRDLRAVGTAEESVIWYQPMIFPIRNGGDAITHIGYIYRDVTEQVRQSETLVEAQQAIEIQRGIIQQLSTPIVEIWDGILLIPLVGAIDDRRATSVIEDLLIAIGTHTADTVILDITGVPTVDTQVANYLLMAARAARLLGAAVALVGIRSEIAQTLVALGVDLSQLNTKANLKAGIAWALAGQGMRIARVASSQ
jgi:anti-anti-sigma regulatory factor